MEYFPRSLGLKITYEFRSTKPTQLYMEIVITLEVYSSGYFRK